MNVLLYAPPLLLLMLKVHIYVQYLSGYVAIFFFVSLHRNAHVACFLHAHAGYGYQWRVIGISLGSSCSGPLHFIFLYICNL